MKTTKSRSIGASPTVKSTARRPSTSTPRASVRVSLKSSKRSEPTEPSGRTLAPAHIQLPREGVRVETESVPHEVRSALTLYMQDAVEVPLLSIEEEIELAARIKKGDMAAREHMIRANLRLVVKIARDYDGLGLPLLDLINEGNIGLMKGVERFDPAKGGKLSTYAAWWIKQSIKRGLANQGKTIRLPVHLVDRVSKIRRTAMKLHEELEREPTDAEVAEVLGMTAERVTELIQATYRPASLDAPLGDDDDTRVADIVKDENATTAYQDLEATTRQDLVRELVDELDPRELTIISYRFGLDGGPERTLEEVGQKFGVTRERIRQIQNVALNKLRKKIEKREAVRDPEFDEFMRQAA